MSFNGKRILLGVTGGIAAYKAAELARRLIGCGARVKVVMTRSAQEFVGPLTFAALTGEEGGDGQVRAGKRSSGARSPGPGGGRHRGGPGHRQFYRQGGRRHRGRFAHHHHAGGHPAGADLPGHEHRDVGQPGGAGESGPAQRPGLAGDGAGRRVPGLRRRGLGPLAGAGPDCRGRRPPALCSGPGGAAGVGHRRAHP